MSILNSNYRYSCQGRVATREVFGCFINSPSLVLENPLRLQDFIEPLYQVIYGSIWNLCRDGANKLDVLTIERYLQEKYPARYVLYNKYDGTRYLTNAVATAHVDNFKLYYEEIRKYSLLRDYIDAGISVDYYFNPDELDAGISEQRIDRFQKDSLEKMGEYFKNKILSINAAYGGPANRNSIKAGGDAAKAQKELWKKGISYGLSYASNYLTCATDGLHQKRLTIASAASNVGKAIPDYLIIPTPTGPRKVSKICVGDYLFGKNGKPVQVLKIYPQATEKEIWEVTFEDGRVTECCEDHLWSYYTGKKNDKLKTSSLKDIYISTNAQGKGFKETSIGNNSYYRFRVPLCDPLEYHLGGIGTEYSNVVQKIGGMDIPAHLVGAMISSPDFYDLSEDMQALMYKAGEAVLYDIPEHRYNMLRAIFTNKTTILSGENTYVFSTKKMVIRDIVFKLAQELGFKVTSGILVDNSDQSYIYNIGLVLEKQQVNPAYKNAKNLNGLDEYEILNPKFVRYSKAFNVNAIIQIRPTGKKTAMRCFTVDARDSLFVMNNACVTHNTRISLANIAHTFAVEFWDTKTKQWIKNPNGQQNRVLYIGTEQELRTELEPVLEAYIAGVPEEHILHPEKYTEDEEDRIDYAIDVLTRSNIYMEYLPEYTLASLEETISHHVFVNHIDHVFFDYIHTTTNLVAEYKQLSGQEGREDQVLGNVGNALKNWSRTYNISIDTATQLNGEYGNENIRDQRLIRGSKALADKADVCYIMSIPTEHEMKKIEPYLRECILKGKLICLSVYKNRATQHKNIKIWLDVEYGTMRIHDLFVTDYDYTLYENIDPVVVKMNEDTNTVEFYKNYSTMLATLNGKKVDVSAGDVVDFQSLDNSINTGLDNIVSEEDNSSQDKVASETEVNETDLPNEVKVSNEANLKSQNLISSVVQNETQVSAIGSSNTPRTSRNGFRGVDITEAETLSVKPRKVSASFLDFLEPVDLNSYSSDASGFEQ